MVYTKVQRDIKKEAAAVLYKAGMNYRAIAQAVGVSRQTISLWIRGCK